MTLNTRELEREPKRFTVRHEVDIPVQVPSSAGEGQLEAAVVGPDQESVPSSVTKEDDGYYHIRFVPRQTGEHRVMVMYGGKEVSSSPYVIRIRDATSMKVKVTEMEQMRTGYSAQKEVSVIIIFVCLTFTSDDCFLPFSFFLIFRLMSLSKFQKKLMRFPPLSKTRMANL